MSLREPPQLLSVRRPQANWRLGSSQSDPHAHSQARRATAVATVAAATAEEAAETAAVRVGPIRLRSTPWKADVVSVVAEQEKTRSEEDEENVSTILPPQLLSLLK